MKRSNRFYSPFYRWGNWDSEMRVSSGNQGRAWNLGFPFQVSWLMLTQGPVALLYPSLTLSARILFTGVEPNPLPVPCQPRGGGGVASQAKEE